LAAFSISLDLEGEGFGATFRRRMKFEISGEVQERSCFFHVVARNGFFEFNGKSRSWFPKLNH
jgi:hypothetical protein